MGRASKVKVKGAIGGALVLTPGPHMEVDAAWSGFTFSLEGDSRKLSSTTLLLLPVLSLSSLSLLLWLSAVNDLEV